MNIVFKTNDAKTVLFLTSPETKSNEPFRIAFDFARKRIALWLNWLLICSIDRENITFMPNNIFGHRNAGENMHRIIILHKRYLYFLKGTPPP